MPEMHQRLLIDDKGRTRSIEDEQLRSRLGPTASPAELEDFAIRVLGFIGVHCRLRRFRVILRPLLVTGEAMAGACQLLADEQPARIALSVIDKNEGWTHSIFGSFFLAMQAIEELVGSLPRRDLSYQTIERPVGQLLRRPNSYPLAAMFRMWRSKLHQFDADTERTLDRLTAPSRSSIFECAPGSHRLLIRRWGATTFYSPEWNRHAIGRDIEDQPDRDYGWRVAANMRRCATSGEPMLHEVEAVIGNPNGFATKISYQRLVLRWEESANVELVTTTSLVTSAQLQAG